ncbi:MAG: peptidyl-prolyl cis-trans isomerase [Gammaproteobacteria bacterium]|nr:peptidyl-prolyl cis-trans isomerase [Gammaproteobacteria bacterium]
MSKPFTITLGKLLIIMTTLAANPSHGADDAPRVLLQTSQGDITLELDRTRAPATVDNFLTYVRDGFFDGTIFHRVIKKFMIQGGGFTGEFQQKPTRPPIKNEADNGLKNLRGTIAMARTSNPQSATAQFFINTVDNGFLDFRDQTQSGWGYAVFGKVVAGMETVDKIENLPTGGGGPIPRDVPQTMVTIEKATVVSAGDKPASP